MDVPRIGSRALTLVAALASFAVSSVAGAAPQDFKCARLVKARVVALDQVLTVSRMGSTMPGGMIFALADDVVPSPPSSSCDGKTLAPGCVGLREGKRPRPIVLRANEGDCLEIAFTNLLSNGNGRPPTRTAAIHVQGMPWLDGPKDDGAFVGANPNSTVAPGKQAVYRLIAEREGPYLLYSTGDDFSPVAGGGDGGQLAQGLFGAMNVEPSGHPFGESWQSEYYRSQVTEEDLCLASADGVYTPGKGCARKSPGTLPTLDYQALYPKGHPRQFLPILNMMCSQELTPEAINAKVCADLEVVHGDLTAMITGPSVKGEPQRFPDLPVNLRPPSLRPVYASPDRLQPYREFTIIYHESFQVAQAFQGVYGKVPSATAAQDNFGINYGMGGLAPVVVANRFGVGPQAGCVDCKFEEFFLTSWVLGDPALKVDNPPATCVDTNGNQQSCKPSTKAFYPDDPSNVYHSYISDHVKFRILHGASDLHHLHHQHAHQWLASPNSPDSDYLDSQSIGPGSAFTLEMVYNGAGNVNQTVGDSIFHCHFYPHFASGMWSLWRTHDVFEPGTILDAAGRPAARKNPFTGAMEYPRALPDGEIAAGTPTPALVPMATLPMAPMPAPIRLQGVCSKDATKNCFADGDCGAAGSCTHPGSRYCVVETAGEGKEECLSEMSVAEPLTTAVEKASWDWQKKVEPAVRKYKNPGYPFFIPGIGGSRAPHPPLDFAWACAKSGKICTPYPKSVPTSKYLSPFAEDLPNGACEPVTDGECQPIDGGLPRNVIARGTASDWIAPAGTLTNTDYSKFIAQADAIKLPEFGTLFERVAMATHAERFHDTQLPNGRKTGICSDNRAPCTPTDLVECANPQTATCDPKGRINFILNGLPPQPGAPYADPCIQFDRDGGEPPDMLTRDYVAADLQLDAVFNKAGWHFPQQRILSLWGDVRGFLTREKPPEPLFMRVNSYDCMSYILANLVPNVYELDDFQVRTPTDIIGQHIHLVKFDVTSSDGSSNGWNYEDGTFGPNEVTERIDAINKGGGLHVIGQSKTQTLKPQAIKFFGPGPNNAWVGAQATVQRWYDDPLFNNFGVCEKHLEQRCVLGQEADLAQQRKDKAWLSAARGASDIKIQGCPDGERCIVSAGICSDDPFSKPPKLCTEFNHDNCAKGAECIPSQDRTLRTVFTHDHFGPSTHQQAGLYAGVVAEPKGSVWRDNETGEIMGGYDHATGDNYPGRVAKQNGVEIRDGGPTSWQAVIETPGFDQSFREFMLEVQDSTLIYKPFSVGTNPFEVTKPGEEPHGFCSYTGQCSNDRSKICLISSLGSGKGDTSNCGDSQATCLFGWNYGDPKNPYLTECTPDPPGGLSACYTSKFANTGVVESCNFVTGVPANSWRAGGPIGSPVSFNNGTAAGVEAITFSGATNNFSFNYRNEPLYPRTTTFTSGNSALGGGLPLAGSPGDLGFVYASYRFCSNEPTKRCATNAGCGTGGTCAPRPNPRGQACSNNLSVYCTSVSDCPTDAAGNQGLCQAVGFCSDNYNTCVSDNRSLCGLSSASCLADPWSSPYKPLTVGVEPDDPFTPLLRAYASDDVQIRTLIGAHINPHNFTLHGLNWLKESSFVDSGWRNTEVTGISEHFESVVKLPPAFVAPESAAGKVSRPWADFLYQPGAAAIEQASGNWGLIRSYDQSQDDLYPLPGSDPLARVATCPGTAPERNFSVVALTALQALGGALVYNSTQGIGDPQALLFFDAADPNLQCGTKGDWSTCYYKGPAQPLVLRAAAGDCIHVTLYNGLPPATNLTCSLNQGGPPATCAFLGQSCGPANGGGVCGIFVNGEGRCSTDYTKSCTPTTVSLKCPPVLCTGGTCSNGVGGTCNASNPCPVPQCMPAIAGGVGSLQLVNTQTQAPMAKSYPSLEVGLRPQLVTFDPRFNDGTNAGFNPVQTASPGESVTYTWYAGDIEKGIGKPERYIPIEFGAANLLAPDPLNHYLHGLFAGLIIEPQSAELTADMRGPTALVKYKDPKGQPRQFREFVVFAQDDTNNLKTLPNNQVKMNAVNYKAEPLLPVQRFCDSSCSATNVSCVLAASAFCKSSSGACVACNSLPGPPVFPETPIFTANVGEAVRFRLLHGGGTNTNNVFEIYGHNFSEAPYMTPPQDCFPTPIMHTNLAAAQFLGTLNLCGSLEFYGKKNETHGGFWDVSLNEWKGSKMGQGPTMHFDVLIDQAGGPAGRCGDYLYRSYPADHFNQGFWGIFRVEGCPTSSASGGTAQPAVPGGK